MKYTYAYKTSDGTRHEAAMEAAFTAYAKNELSAESDIAIDAGEERELRELKQIVNGIREEMRQYLANGNGTPRSFWRRLNERTAQELLDSGEELERRDFGIPKKKEPMGFGATVVAVALGVLAAVFLLMLF